MRLRNGIYPRDGYRFVEKDGTILTSKRDWLDLLKIISEYRRRNNFEPGEPLRELILQISETEKLCVRCAGPVKKRKKNV